jgi:SAM-dependent methyltransferase
MTIAADQGHPMNTHGSVWRGDERLSVWALNQTNTALRDDAATRSAEALLRSAGLPTHPDRTKNWDTFLALYHAMTHVEPFEAILDAGAERYSAFLPALSRCGYRDLTAINLTFGAPQKADGITFRNGDITRTGIASQSYAFIACLSVIEHGVDIAAFLQESARLLVPGGRLFLSFDYWEEPVDTRGQHAYGVPIRVFTRRDIDEKNAWLGREGRIINRGCCGFQLQGPGRALAALRPSLHIREFAAPHRVRSAAVGVLTILVSHDALARGDLPARPRDV